MSTSTNHWRWLISYIRSHILCGKIFLCQPLPIIAGGLSAIADHTFSVARYFYVNLYQSLQVVYQLYQITHSLWQDISMSTSTNHCRWLISYVRSHILCCKLFLCQPLPIIAGGLSAIADHTFSVARYFYTNLRSLQHSNGRALAEVYCHGNFEDPATQGAIITFNCLRANGDYIGFSEVL